MTAVERTFTSPRPAHELFAYLADFSNSREWDPVVREARQTTQGPIGEGTGFEVRCGLPLGSVTLDYRIVEYVPGERLCLHGHSRWFEVDDSIVFEETEDGTQITYRAEFSGSAPVNAVLASMQGGLEKMADRSIRGLQSALADEQPAPSDASAAGKPSLTLLPELSRFTRLGYRRGAAHWQPLSAYAGDLHVVITGASSGLGHATAMELARRGARLTLVMRDEQRAAKVRDTISAETGNDDIQVEIADLSLLEEVDKLARRLRRRRAPVDVLINNAGALFNEQDSTAEGIEQSLALLLLSPYRLTLGLLPALRRSQQPRVINVVSGGMYTQRLDLDRLLEPGDYNGAVQYARAKRALMVATEEWAEAWQGEGIVVNAMHPGWADTPGVESALPLFHRLMKPLLRSPEEGADTIVWLALATEAAKVSGKLFLDREIQPTYLLAKTREAAGERKRLMAFLERSLEHPPLEEWQAAAAQ
jgi:dehydrogenase/reductase SDR family protein 12